MCCAVEFEMRRAEDDGEASAGRWPRDEVEVEVEIEVGAG